VNSGVSDVSNTRTTEGTYSFAPHHPGETGGTLTMHANGNQATLTFTDLSIIQNTTIPGAVGQGEVPLTLVYFRP
jgi:hypothetical protein